MTRATRRLEHAGQPDLFGEAPVAAIEGLRYENGFLSREEEAGLLAIVQAFPLKEMRYKNTPPAAGARASAAATTSTPTA